MNDPVRRLLVVITDPASRAPWVQAAMAAGYACIEVDGPVAAISAARAAAGALAGILVERSLPGMGPVLLLRALRSIPGMAALPALVAGGTSEIGGLLAVAEPAGLAAALAQPVQAAPPGAAAASPPVEPVIDRTVVTRVRGYGEEMFQGLVGTYLDELPGRIEQAAALITAGDLAGAGGIAHSLKGSSGSIGLRRLWRACADFDHGCRTAAADLPQRLLAVRAAAAEAEHVMRAELAQTNPGG